MTTEPSHPNDGVRQRRVWTPESIRELGAVTDLTTAASIFRLSRTVAYDLAKRDRFPVPVIRAGTRYRVPVAAILTTLGIDRHYGPRLDVPAGRSVDRDARISSPEAQHSGVYQPEER
jgi:hypothetical protein